MTANKQAQVRVAVDIGGTFTDLHLYDSRSSSGKIYEWKTPSTPTDPSIGLLKGLEEITRVAGIQPGDINMILHGSTIATNAVLERKLPKGALLTTAGFEDVLEIGRHMRSDVYTLSAEPRPLLIPRHLRFGIKERVKADGSVLETLDLAATEKVISTLLHEEVETVAIVFLHGYRNPIHEHQTKELLQKLAPQLTVTTSFDSSPEIREFERSSTTVLNALLQPVISSYLEKLGTRLSTAGINAELFLVQSNGGLATPADAASLPAKLLLSGPAGGATAMSILAQRHSIDNLVGFDVGGTSSDISVVADGEIGETQESSIDGLPVRLPMVEIRTIGAGGGSIARVETAGLRVGPQSAGAEPGPVCYDRGGSAITVTDANAILGLIDAGSFKTGGINLNIQAAEQQLQQNLCQPLSLDTPTAANGVLEIANSHMADAIRLSLFEKGADPADFALAPFGGAAGLHACAVATDLGIHRIIFPAHASTLSALGILQADLRHDLSVAALLPADDQSLPELQLAVQQLHSECREQLEQNGLAQEQQKIEFSCDMRYRGQAFELTTPWPELSRFANSSEITINPESLSGLIQNFHHMHEQRFTFTVLEDPVEIVSVRARAIGKLGQAGNPQQPDQQAGNATDAPASSSDNAKSAKRTRTLRWGDQQLDVPCIDRAVFLQSSASTRGPLIIEEEYTVLMIAEGWSVKPLPGGDILCERIS